MKNEFYYPGFEPVQAGSDGDHLSPDHIIPMRSEEILSMQFEILKFINELSLASYTAFVKQVATMPFDLNGWMESKPHLYSSYKLLRKEMEFEAEQLWKNSRSNELNSVLTAATDLLLGGVQKYLWFIGVLQNDGKFQDTNGLRLSEYGTQFGEYRIRLWLLKLLKDKYRNEIQQNGDAWYYQLPNSFNVSHLNSEQLEDLDVITYFYYPHQQMWSDHDWDLFFNVQRVGFISYNPSMARAPLSSTGLLESVPSLH